MLGAEEAGEVTPARGAMHASLTMPGTWPFAPKQSKASLAGTLGEMEN